MNVLVICKKCQTQYDVSQRKAGDAVRCQCGASILVPVPEVHDGRMVRCPSCGAVRGSGGGNCEYCGARLSAVDKGWGSMCPACFCRLPNDAQYCVECGLRISPQKLEAVASDLACPRCQCKLQLRKLEQLNVQECSACAGLWLPVETFEFICKHKETLGMAQRGLASKRGPRKFELTEQEQVKYVPCPKCKNLMNRRNFGAISGVIIDTCRDCGVWLDNQELGRIIQFIESGGLDKARQREVEERAHSEKMKPKPPSGGHIVEVRLGRAHSDDIVAGVLGRAVAELAKAFFK